MKIENTENFIINIENNNENIPESTLSFKLSSSRDAIKLLEFQNIQNYLNLDKESTVTFINTAIILRDKNKANIESNISKQYKDIPLQDITYVGKNINKDFFYKVLINYINNKNSYIQVYFNRLYDNNNQKLKTLELLGYQNNKIFELNDTDLKNLETKLKNLVEKREILNRYKKNFKDSITILKEDLDLEKFLIVAYNLSCKDKNKFATNEVDLVDIDVLNEMIKNWGLLQFQSQTILNSLKKLENLKKEYEEISQIKCDIVKLYNDTKKHDDIDILTESEILNVTRLKTVNNNIEKLILNILENQLKQLQEKYKQIHEEDLNILTMYTETGDEILINLNQSFKKNQLKAINYTIQQKIIDNGGKSVSQTKEKQSISSDDNEKKILKYFDTKIQFEPKDKETKEQITEIGLSCYDYMKNEYTSQQQMIKSSSKTKARNKALDYYAEKYTIAPKPESRGI